ncbi:Aldo keto reductase [Chlorella sorokiniana]|uniref:Aldo keto reductase n=1 Tax=Chlorella sorokiniana TaxID=3076 RepID=A0A2P6U0W5_CHLSO|nr:Aldo keto reductase [Chlorella sorokiniana]|eukprot:PRW59954.1 Aldo keto reductase [Chlorella sorokiniana]
MTALYSSNPVPKEECLATIKEAVASGVTFFDTAEAYNVCKTTDNNEQLLGEAIKGLPRDQVVIATKWGIYINEKGEFITDGSRKHCREAVEKSLQYLDPNTPIEESMQAMKELVEEGKIRHIGLSEVSPEDVRKAHAIHPVTAYQLEWSLWSRDAEVGWLVVQKGGSAGGFLTGAIRSPADLSEQDFRRVGQPRFAEEAFAKNMELVERMTAVAQRKGATASQLALAWVLAQGPDVVPIPGTRRIKYLKENLGAAAIQLTPEDLQELNGIFSHDKARAVGELYALPMDGGVVRVAGAAHCLKTFANRMQPGQPGRLLTACNLDSPAQVQALLGNALDWLHGWLAGELGIKHPPSAQAAAALYLGRKGRGAVPLWPSVLRTLTGSNPVPKEECLATIKEAVASGVTFFDTAEAYNVCKTTDNNEQLLGEAIKGLPRDQVVIATKWGIYINEKGEFITDGSRKHCREAVEKSLQYLDPNTPIEESMQAMKELVEEGKIRHIGLSEVSPEDVRKAHAIHPVTAYQLEWSLWSRDAEVGWLVVQKGGSAGGFLTGAIRSPADLSEQDFRRVGQPRFAEEAFAKNMELVERMTAVAQRKGATASQLALAWVLAQGPDVVPIPGTRRIKYLKENLGAAAIQLTPEDLQELNGIFSHDKARAVGELYALPMDGGVVRVAGAAHCLKTFANRMQPGQPGRLLTACNLDSPAQVQALLGNALDWLHGWLAGELGIKHPPSAQAVAALYLGRKGRGAVPLWPSVLRTLTGYHEDSHPEFAALLREVLHIPQYGRIEFKADLRAMAGQLDKRKIGGLEVSCMGLGLMGMTAFYATNPVPTEECVATIKEALASGVTLFDTAELYNAGKSTDNNEQLLGEAIQGLPRDQVVIATKWGIYINEKGEFITDGSRKHCREAVEKSLQYLDPNTPIEESMQAMKELVEEGKIRHIGLSEVSPEDVRKAHAIHPVTAYQLEWSLWSRDAEVGWLVVQKGGSAGGFLTGAIRSPADLSEQDFRRVGQPRFAEEAFAKNMELVERMTAVAQRKGATASQLALAWVLAQGPDVVPIPGTRRIKYLKENLGAAAIQLTPEDLQELNGIFSHDKARAVGELYALPMDGGVVVGERYPEPMMRLTFHYSKHEQKQS